MRAGMGLSDAQVQAQGLGAPRNAALHPHQQKITMLDTLLNTKLIFVGVVMPLSAFVAIVLIIRLLIKQAIELPL